MKITEIKNQGYRNGVIEKMEETLSKLNPTIEKPVSHTKLAQQMYGSDYKMSDAGIVKGLLKQTKGVSTVEDEKGVVRYFVN